ncbi:MAG TPA: SDR family oxidoreductase [Myxococcota bacterium]|nr:SDR family oxidoreductase [Myxococcota bacterium]
MELSGKTCVITGGASGIGLATAFAFGAKGTRVVIGDINEKAVEAALVALKGQDIEALGQLCDVRDEDSVASIETPMVMKDMQPQALERFKATIPVGRLGRPEEIAAAAVFIAENDLVTGTCVDVTGGIRL